MKRRHLLGATAAGLAATAWPAFLREAFGDGAACDETGKPAAAAGSLVQVSAAFRRARQSKRALLVFVIPADDGAKWERGHAFGELLNFGADRDLAPLAGVEVVCATMADLKKLVPSAGDGEPLLVVVRTDKVPVAATQLDVALPSYDGMRLMTGNREELLKRDDTTAARRIGALGALLRKGLGAGAENLETRAASVRARLVKAPPAGAHWAVASGCGTEVEGVDETGLMACGMGHVPSKSRRFLYFFAVERRGASPR
ncbi:MULTISPECIES: hypothetical protein [Sorangium]|uniref:Secreted protein n=1 Tax=Sorangium cellulosum TaxID=56 RepID=A0A4P2QF68_SORCE|nr:MULTISPECIES: hypothetical protein [Sorangium]AUX28111.1 hypothetical protein SOCE836_001790 [Sorangium cellulosum]WCQ87515.1 hypothetical protein NQZ70_00178 [Sorangium sp. Soce836]